VANLALVVFLLVATVLAGRAGRRPLHFLLVGLTLPTLVAAIVQAEFFGRDFHFEPLRLRIHLVCAALALLSLPAVAWSGRRLIRLPEARHQHRRFVGIFLVLTLAAVGTALWMFLTATPVPD